MSIKHVYLIATSGAAIGTGDRNTVWSQPGLAGHFRRQMELMCPSIIASYQERMKLEPTQYNSQLIHFSLNGKFTNERARIQ